MFYELYILFVDSCITSCRCNQWEITGCCQCRNVRSRVIKWISNLLKPVTKYLFDEIPQDSPAIGDIAMNFSANAFGLSNAATPFGIKAMEELQKENKDKTTASNAMCLFLGMNTAGFQLIPTTVLAVLVGIGYKNPTEIIAPTLLVTLIAFISAIIFAKIGQKLYSPQKVKEGVNEPNP